jgi:hypothetical protein
VNEKAEVPETGDPFIRVDVGVQRTGAGPYESLEVSGHNTKLCLNCGLDHGIARIGAFDEEHLRDVWASE